VRYGRKHKNFDHLVAHWKSESEFLHEFPQVKTAFICTQETGSGILPELASPSLPTKIGPDALPIWRSGGIQKCSNQACYRGGFDFVGRIRKCIRDKDTAFEGVQPCMGKEKRGATCLNRLKLKIQIEYI